LLPPPVRLVFLAKRLPETGEEMPARRVLGTGAATILAAGALLGLAAGPAGAATSAPASGANAARQVTAARPLTAAMIIPAAPLFTCYFPITGFYCSVQTLNGHAPLFRSSGALYTTLPLNDNVHVSCYYKGNPPAPWKGDGYEDHVIWENIPSPITGHIPDYYINLNNQTPGQAGIPPC
jgi:hypothetical protein